MQVFEFFIPLATFPDYPPPVVGKSNFLSLCSLKLPLLQGLHFKFGDGLLDWIDEFLH